MQKILFSYLRFWAVRYLNRTKPEIIAVTGSVGKTSAKDAIFAVLNERYRDEVRKSHGNLNNETGVPLSILGFHNSPNNFLSWIPILLSVPFKSMTQKKYRFLILELAADKPGDIKYLTSFIHPKIAVLTAIGPAHMEAFGNLEKIIEEKANLLRALPIDGKAILNIEDANVRKISYGGRWEKSTYAISEDADYVAKNIETKISNYEGSTSFEVVSKKYKFKAETLTLGKEGNVLACLSAIAIGKIYDLTNPEIIAGLKNFENDKHRMNVFKGKNGSTIIDDSYNANPLSMKSALKMLNELPSKGRKIAVIGDMREIGKISTEAHILMGKYAHEVADIVIGVGKIAKKYDAKNYFTSPKKALDFLLKEVKENDIILIKASRSIGLDKIADILKG